MEGAVRSGHAASHEALTALATQNGSRNGAAALNGSAPGHTSELIAGGSG
jgi:hypothetical protein